MSLSRGVFCQAIPHLLQGVDDDQPSLGIVPQKILQLLLQAAAQPLTQHRKAEGFRCFLRQLLQFCLLQRIPGKGHAIGVDPGDTPPAQAVPDIPDGASHSRSRSRGDADRLLPEHGPFRAMDHPPIAIVVQKRLHLPAGMIDKHRRGEDQKIRLIYHPGDPLQIDQIVRAVLLPFPDTSGTAAAEFRHILWQKDLLHLVFLSGDPVDQSTADGV